MEQGTNETTAEIEQLAQQQRDPTPVVFKQIEETALVTDRGIRLHLLALDETGGIWERWSDEPDGVWHKLAPPLR